MPLKRVVCALVLFVQFWTLIIGPTASGQNRRPGRVPAPRLGNSMADGLKIRLSEGVEQAERAARITPAAVRALNEGDTRNVLGRLQAIKVDAADEKDFAL